MLSPVTYGLSKLSLVACRMSHVACRMSHVALSVAWSVVVVVVCIWCGVHLVWCASGVVCIWCGVHLVHVGNQPTVPTVLDMGETSRVKVGLDWNLESKRPLEKSIYLGRYFSLGGHDDDKMRPIAAVAAVAAGDLLIPILHLAIRVALALSTSKHLCAQEVLTSHHNT